MLVMMEVEGGYRVDGLPGPGLMVYRVLVLGKPRQAGRQAACVGLRLCSWMGVRPCCSSREGVVLPRRRLWMSRRTCQEYPLCRTAHAVPHQLAVLRGGKKEQNSVPQLLPTPLHFCPSSSLLPSPLLAPELPSRHGQAVRVAPGRGLPHLCHPGRCSELPGAPHPTCMLIACIGSIACAAFMFSFSSLCAPPLSSPPPSLLCAPAS